MIQSLPSSDGLLVTIVLATLAIGLPIVLVLSIRFLLDRNLNLGRSKELEKLIWQLHRIASAMEQPNEFVIFRCSDGRAKASRCRPSAAARYPAARYYANCCSQCCGCGTCHSRHASGSRGTTGVSAAATSRPRCLRPRPRETSAQGERHGVNSMFGFELLCLRTARALGLPFGDPHLSQLGILCYLYPSQVLRNGLSVTGPPPGLISAGLHSNFARGSRICGRFDRIFLSTRRVHFCPQEMGNHGAKKCRRRTRF